MPLLTQNRGCTRFYGLMLHPINDACEATGGGLILSGSLISLADEFPESPKTLSDRTVGQWRNMKVALHYFPKAQRWMLLHVFDWKQVVTPDGLVPPGEFNPTTQGQFNDSEVRFWSEQFWNPAVLTFDDPEPTSCEKHFQDRILPGSLMN